MIARPIDPETKKEWPMDAIRQVQAKFWKDAEDELNAIDEERSGGRLCADNGYKVTHVVGESIDKLGNKTMKLAVSDELSRLKHSGKDRRRLFTTKWTAFLREPLPLAGLTTLVLQDEREDEIKRQEAFAESVDVETPVQVQ